MNLEIKDLGTKIQPMLEWLKRYATFIFVIVILFVISFLVFRINQFSNQKPSDDVVTEKLQTVQRPRIDEAVIDKIQQLQGQNIEVQSLFDQARNNPFAE